MRALLSFVIVLVAYGIYAAAAVPWIEPSVNRRSLNASSAGNGFNQDATLKAYSRYFSRDAWELQNPKVLKTEQGATVLWQKDETLEDGSLFLSPCTVIYESKNSDSGGPVLLQAPTGAKLRFDKPLDSRQIEIGKLIGGMLNGEIRITRPEAKGDQRLLIITRDVRINERQLWTPEIVKFRLGDHRGSGQHLLIQFLQQDSKEGIADLVEFVELTRIQQVILSVSNQAAMFGGRPSQTPKLDPTQQVKAAKKVPVILTADGKFRLLMLDQIATLEDNVRLFRPNDGFPDDQLSCDLLTLHFKPAQKDEAKDGASGENSGFDLKRITAVGQPVKVDAPSRASFIRTDRLEYDFEQRQFDLNSPTKSIFRDANNQIETKRISCQTDAEGNLIRVRADGAGKFAGQLDEKSGQKIAASWDQQLFLQPSKQQKVLSIIGSANVRFDEEAHINADRIDLWLDPKPQTVKRGTTATSKKTANPSQELEPRRMLARGNVSFGSEQLTGEVKRLETWFVNAPPKRGPGRRVGASGARPANQPANQRPRRETQPNKKERKSLFGRSSDDQRIYVEGEVLQLRVEQRGEQSEPTDLTLSGNAHFVQESLKPALKAKNPVLDVRGESVQVSGASETTGVVVVRGDATKGQLARVVSDGMLIEAPAINLDRKQNRVWIDEAGHMSLPMTKDLRGRPLARPQQVRVTWEKSMTFDGKAATLIGNVDAKSTNQHLMTNWLQVVLVDRIDFRKPSQKKDSVQILGFAADQGVNFRNKTYEEGKLVSIDRFVLRDIQINQQTGKMFGAGPGWFATVRTNDQSSEFSPGLSLGGANNSTKEKKSKPLVNVQTTFQGNLDGNTQSRVVRFNDQVAMIYVPIERWMEPTLSDGRKRLPADAIEMECDQLSLEQLTQVEGKWQSTIKATGNTRVFGQTFNAKAAQIKYVEAKDQLILEGQGRAQAELYYQPPEGGQETKAVAGKIFYWPKTKRALWNEGEYIEWNNLEAFLPPARDAAKNGGPNLGPGINSRTTTIRPRQTTIAPRVSPTRLPR